MRRIFAVGHNMVGYLPESDVYFTDSFESAKSSLIEDMDRVGDHYFSVGDSIAEDEPSHHQYKEWADELSGAMEDLNLSNGPEWGTVVGNVSYWINDVTNDRNTSERPLDELSEDEFSDLLDDLNGAY